MGRSYRIFSPNSLANFFGTWSFPPRIRPSSVFSLKADAIEFANTIFKADIREGAVVDSVPFV